MFRSKLYREQRKRIDRAVRYTLDEGVAALKAIPHVKFDETVDLAVRLGIDPRQSDQGVRGAISLPHGSGKAIRVVVIAEGAAAEAAKEAGADEVGYEDLLNRIKDGWLDFDMMIATPLAMQKVRTLGKVLGPRGLMPNPKTGTVADDTGAAVREVKAGRVEYRNDKTGCVHIAVGKISFSKDALRDNIAAVLQAIARAKPPSAKGIYFLSCTVSSTMSPGIRLDISDFATA